MPNGFQTLATTPFPVPFVAGHPYDVDILARGDTVAVSIDNGLVRLQQSGVPSHGGGFGLKAFASTVRFARVQAWDSDVPLLNSAARDGASLFGSRIGLYRDVVGNVSSLVPCQDFLHFLDPVSRQPLEHHPSSDVEKQKACNPIFSQLHGFHDANNVIGEATSHGTFLAGLMDLWTARAARFTPDERESLRHAIQTTALYLEELYQQGNATGEFAHSEMGRGGVDTNLGLHQTLIALYGESAFAAYGAFVDRTLAKRACFNSIDSARWLSDNQLFGDPTWQAVIFARIARCIEREGTARDAELFWNPAAAAAAQVLDVYKPYDPGNQSGGAIALLPRDTGRVIPWFEGVYEVFRSHPDKLPNRALLSGIADLLVSHLTREHVCDDAATGRLCPANGFFALPQGTGPLVPFANWFDMESVPRVVRPVAPADNPDPEKPGFLHFYNIQGHFPAAVADSVYLWRMTGNSDLERVASGNYYWMLGLNPGVPSQKVIGGVDEGPWRAAAFVRNLAAFARGFEGYRTIQTSSKGSPLPPWEGDPASPHREAWFVDVLENGFRSTVNGHVLWDEQWDYWNVGKYGWASGETFLLGDGAC